MTTTRTKTTSAATAAKTRNTIKPRNRKARNVQLLIERHEQLKAQAKELYQEMDVVFAELLESMEVEQAVVLPDGRSAAIVDNFLDKNGDFRNTAFRPCGVKRFELKVK